MPRIKKCFICGQEKKHGELVEVLHQQGRVLVCPYHPGVKELIQGMWDQGVQSDSYREYNRLMAERGEEKIQWERRGDS